MNFKPNEVEPAGEVKKGQCGTSAESSAPDYHGLWTRRQT